MLKKHLDQAKQPAVLEKEPELFNPTIKLSQEDYQRLTPTEKNIYDHRITIME